MPKFKIGELVRVRDDLVVGRKYGIVGEFLYPMEKYKGKIYPIKSYSVFTKDYYLYGNDWCFAEGMLEKVNKENLADYIKQFLDENKEVFKNFDVSFTVKAKPQILDEAEKRYLSNVIRPFRDRVLGIAKFEKLTHEYQYIIITIENELSDIFDIEFPFFKSNTMYKGMTVGKEYTLEELGL